MSGDQIYSALSILILHGNCSKYWKISTNFLELFVKKHS